VVSDQAAEEAQRDEEVAKGDLAVAASEVDVAKAQFSDARAQYAFERAILDQHVLVAPFDAVVVDRQRELGTVIKAGDPILTLIDPASVWALAYIDESRSGAIELGQPAEVRLRSLPQQTMQARVIRIGIESDRVSEERRVYVKCEQCPARFHLGEQAEVLVTVAQLANALLVPEAAVSGFDGRQGTVWTVEDGRLRRRTLSFGHRTENAMLEVVGGLPAGAHIVSALISGLGEGRAAIVAAGAQP
jgi:HlyD family secretion protein